MANTHGSFIWYELLTSDPDAAGRFYAELLGWTTGSYDGTPGYTIFSRGEAGIGGMMRAPEGVRPCWLGYVGVDDVDAAAAAFVEAGGAVQMPPRDLPGVGRIAMVADPQGAPLYLMRGESDRSSTAFSPDAVGHCAWNELSAASLDAAVEFHASQFGWQRGELMPMGPAGGYQLMLHQGTAFGAIMPRQVEAVPPIWTFYFRVAAIGAAERRAREAGATILHGPVVVPGGDHILIATDPQGALFALVGKPD